MSDDTSEHGDENPNAENLKILRQQARDAQQAQAEAAALKRENLFLKAGVDVDSKVGKLLLKAYEGDDIEELKAEYAELVGTPASNTPPVDEARQAEDAQRAAAQQAAAGGRPANQHNDFEGEHPMTQALGKFHKNQADGMDRNEAADDAFAFLLSKAAQKDPRLNFNQGAHNEAGMIADREAMRSSKSRLDA